MSETGSFRSASPKELEINTVPDEVLDDHRHQVPLPIRSNTNPAAGTYAAGTGSVPVVTVVDFAQPRARVFPAGLSVPDEFAISDDESVDPHQQQQHPHQQEHHHHHHHHQHHHETHRTHVASDQYEKPGYGPIPIVKGSGGSLAAAARRGRSSSKARSHSFSEQIRCLANPKQVDQHAPTGILQEESTPNYSQADQATKTSFSNTNPPESLDPPPKFKRSGSVLEPMSRMRSNDTVEKRKDTRERRPSRSSIDSDADSHASRSSQETEEDVCFPMLPEHVRIKGIDFDEIEEFIREERDAARQVREQQQLIAERTAMRILESTGRSVGDSSSSYTKPSSAALKYTPKRILAQFKSKKRDKNSRRKRRDSSESSSQQSSLESVLVEKKPFNPDGTHFEVEDDGSTSAGSFTGIRFGGARITDSSDPSSLPDRFSFFSSESEETVHAPDIPSLVEPGQSVRELFRNGESTWWLDCVCPTDAEMKTLARAFGIHPLTAEDIRMQETREKVELFRNYYFVCFHTFEPDKESEDYLEPINVYLVVFRDGVLSFHFSPITHPASVRRRVRQLRDYVDVSADWVCYAMIDDITDGFAPVITAIEYEADAIEDSVFVARDTDFSTMLQRIGESRKKVMTLMRLLSGKADVIKMFAKRCQEEAGFVAEPHRIGFNEDGTGGISFGRDPGNSRGPLPAHPTSPAVPPVPQHFQSASVPPGALPPQPQAQGGFSAAAAAAARAQPRADIALYLGDIQDHVVTMFQNLLAYEKIFSRSHSNYLAQLQVESFNSSNRVTAMFSKVTLIGTMLIPLNLITGLFGMNVKVPGMDGETLQWFFGIVGVMVFIVIVSFIFGKYWIDSAMGPSSNSAESSRKSIRSFGMRRNRDTAKSVLSFPNKYE